MTVIPQVNMNGTSVDELIAQNVRAHSALTATQVVMSAAAPHGRDYQTMPAGSYEQAAEDWRVIHMTLDNLCKHFEGIVLGLMDQRDARIK